MAKLRFKIQLVVFFLILLSFFNHCFSTFAQDDADLPGGIMDRLANVATGESGAGFSEVETQTLTETVGNIIKIILTFLGVIFLILVIYGGFMWMTARGNEEQVGKATKLLTESVIGLAIVLGAYLITFFIVNALIGQTGYQGQ